MQLEKRYCHKRIEFPIGSFFVAIRIKILRYSNSYCHVILLYFINSLSALFGPATDSICSPSVSLKQFVLQQFMYLHGDAKL